MKEYLPLGTIVLLKNATKKLMILGRCQIDGSTGIFYDYAGCLYLEGNISIQYTFLFNDNDIHEIIFEGYTDDDEERFIEFINKEIKK